MAEPIVATYAQQGDDWTVTVSGHGKVLTAQAPGIIAARDNTDQLVDQLGPTAKGATVVHLLNGSALEFTSVYMTARLTRPEPAPIEPTAAEPPAPAVAEAVAERTPRAKSTRRPKAKLTTNIGDALTASKPTRTKVELGSAGAAKMPEVSAPTA
ncbi:hypothetical protein [Amycolatopsis taiwanensis]|uniref:Uncharacterized protein n=1 Tax=Amycolatopsis taiwanensis TaxID=342230 RepID=A0A9W6QY59_9PSEU|nr:hypothetical protein [Amycolatopsis taiwanensis]GLY64678.1 hypothetical protein Atai01_12970 [Amycolatopsis taiwanensis]